MATIVIKDKNLVPQNIKRGVTILKVTGTLDASGGGSVNLQEKTANSSTVSQNVTPDQGYDGLSKVTVNPYTLDTKTVDASTVSQTVTSDEDGLSSVTVNPYTLDSKTVDASTVSQTVNSSADGLSSVTVNPYTLETDSSTLTDNGTYVFVPSHANGISQLTIDVSVEGSSDSSVYQTAFGITQAPDLRSAAPRCIITDHVIDNANFVGMSGYIAAPYSQNPYWVFGVDCDVQSRAPANMFGIYVDGNNMTFYFGEYPGLTVSNEETDFQNGAFFSVYEDSDTGDHFVEVNGITYDYEEETGLGWMTNTVSNSLYIFARNANGTAYGIAPEGTFFRYLDLNYDDGDTYAYGFSAAIEGHISESGWFEGSTPVLYYLDSNAGDEGVIQMPSGYSYNVINMYDTVINNNIVNLSEGGDSELVMFNPSEGRPAGVIIPVAGSGGGDTWFVRAKKGEISDVSAYSFDGLEAIEYGAAYACAGSDIETYPELTFGEASQPQRSLKSDMKSGAKAPVTPPVVANHALEGAFRGCSELYNDDAVITINGSVGDHAFDNFLADSHVNDVTIDASAIGGERAFEYAFANATVDGDIVVTASEITNSFASAFQVVNRNDYGRRWGTVSFPNLDTITDNYAFENAFYESYFETVSFPSLDTFEEFSLSQMFANSHVGKLIAHPAMFCYDYEASPICDCNDLTEIELSDTAANDMYFLWQPDLSSASVYSILSNLSDQDPHTVKFWGEYSYDEEQGEEVLTNNLKVYDYPDNRILGALNDAESVGWVINNLTIYPASSVDYITTGNTSTTTIEIPGVKTTDTMMQARGLLNSSGNNLSDRKYIESKNYPSSGRSMFSYYRYSSNEIDFSLGNQTGQSLGDNVYLRNIDFSQVVDSTFGLIKVGTERRAYIASGGSQSTYNAYSTFVVNNTDKLVLKMANWYNIKQWEGWDDTSTGGNSKVLVHDYVPVSYYNSVDDVTEYGLFDTIEAKFYTNSGITGASDR